jgi:hypothetical protein
MAAQKAMRRQSGARYNTPLTSIFNGLPPIGSSGVGSAKCRAIGDLPMAFAGAPIVTIVL